MADQDALARALSGFGMGFRRRSDPRQERRSYYGSMMKVGADTSPVATPLQGLARALQGAAGGYFLGREEDKEEAGMKRLAEALQGKSMPDGTRTAPSLDDIAAAASDAGYQDMGIQVALANALDQRARGQRQGQPSITDIATGGRGGGGSLPPTRAPEGTPETSPHPAEYNNNIGNLVAGPTAWAGKGPAYANKPAGVTFETFTDPVQGVAAAYKNLQYHYGKGATTFDALARRWLGIPDDADANQHGNKWRDWSAAVAGGAGFKPGDAVPINDPQAMARVMRSMNVIEHGRPTVPAEAYLAGVTGGAPSSPIQQAQMPNPPMPTAVPGATPAPMPQPPMPTPGGPNARPAPMPAGPPPATMTRTDTSVMPPVAGPAAGSSGAVPPPVAPTIPMGGPAVPLTMDQIPVQPETPSNAPLRAAEPVGPPTPETAGTKMGADVGAAFGAGIVPPSTRRLLQSPAPTAPPSAAPAPPAAQPATAAPPAPQQQSAPRQPAQFPDTPNTAAALAADYAATAQRFDAEWKRTGDKDMEAEARRYSAMAAAARAEAMRFDAERPLRMAEWQRRTEADARANEAALRQAKAAEAQAGKFTEGQAKDYSYALRLARAIPQFEQMAYEGQRPTALERFANNPPTIAGVPIIPGTKSIQSTFAPESAALAQRFEQTERDMINAILRRESGATISPEEFANARAQYIPQPGDTDAVVRQKLQNLRSSFEGMAIASGKPEDFGFKGKPSLTPPDVPGPPPRGGAGKGTGGGDMKKKYGLD